MAPLDYATPLIAINAIAVDTETTGLDTARSRIVEFGSVRIELGVISADSFVLRINPTQPIPKSASDIHGITTEDVADAPAFAAAWPQIAGAIGDDLWIGHTIGFDLAVLARECARAGIQFAPPQALDTRLLAQIANPNLPGYSLETLSSWLGVEPGPRHSALGDAITTARIFMRLSERLRDLGVRTVGEAMRASAALTNVLDQQHWAGWVEVAMRPPASAPVGNVDTSAFRKRTGDIASRPPRFVRAADSVGAALATMMQERISSLFVSPDGTAAAASLCGIVTERDILRAYATHGAAAAALEVRKISSRPLECVGDTAFLYAASARMQRRHIRHLAVVDEHDSVVGALSARDLLKSQTSEALAFGDGIEAASDSRTLAAAWGKLPRVSEALMADGLDGRELAQVVSHEVAALTARASEIAEAELEARGLGPSPCAYSVLVLGSAGRGESLLAMDQDNAIVFERGPADGAEDKWFAALATRMNDLLHEAGIPLCKGGVMAKNPQWRGSVDTWRARVETWVERSSPKDLLSVDTFFDLRGAGGRLPLASALREGAFAAAKGANAFAKLLVDTAAPIETALGIFGRLRLVEGRIDLKKSGLFRMVCGARALAIRHHVLAYSTRERLEGVRALQLGCEEDLERLIDAHGLFLTLIARQQAKDIAIGVPPSNAIEIAALSKLERERLVEALQSLGTLDTLVKDLLFTD